MLLTLLIDLDQPACNGDGILPTEQQIRETIDSSAKLWLFGGLRLNDSELHFLMSFLIPMEGFFFLNFPLPCSHNPPVLTYQTRKNETEAFNRACLPGENGPGASSSLQFY